MTHALLDLLLDDLLDSRFEDLLDFLEVLPSGCDFTLAFVAFLFFPYLLDLADLADLDCAAQFKRQTV
jgi:hypothetical protein